MSSARGLPPRLFVTVSVGTAGWFFFYAIFALVIRRNDVFNTVTSVFYFVCCSRAVGPLPSPLRELAMANPITWHVDVMRHATIGIGHPSQIWIEALAFLGFTAAAFGAALWALKRQ